MNFCVFFVMELHFSHGKTLDNSAKSLYDNKRFHTETGNDKEEYITTPAERAILRLKDGFGQYDGR